MSNIIYKWNDESTYTGGNPPRQYKKGDVVPLHIFPPNILKQHMMYNRIIKCEPRMIPDVTLSISVMAHPQRANFFQGLRDKLGDVPFSIDQKNNIIENCKAAWRLHDPSADFHVVIQDDAIVCNNFKERAIRFITARESERIAYGNPVQGYNFFIRQEYPAEKMREFEKTGYYLEGRNRGGVAICLPVNQIESMLEFFDTIDNRHDDERISQWVVKNKFRMCFPIPSLIDHNDHNPSLAGNKPNVIRQAYKFIDNEKKVIPKIIHQLWIGPKPPPLKWMQTWKEKNPGWLYRLWTMNDINNYKFINQRHIDFYLKQGLWHGVKDVCQYEILYNEGGAFFDADTECVHPINELFTEEHDAYSYWENEEVRPGLIQPLIAAVKGSQFAKELIEGLQHKPVGGIPWRTTGNQYVGEMYRKTSASVKIFPSGYFNPEHYTGKKSQSDKVYARHYFGSTDPEADTYKKGELNEVPKIIHQLWIGPHEMPERWMFTWKEKHPDWEYRLWTEKELSEVEWKNQRWIDYYIKNEIWSGAKNIYQYEILFNHGGIFVDADTECLEPIDELLLSGHDAYSYFENETTRPGYVQPVLASVKGSKFVEELINDINIKPIVEIERSYIATGNKYVGDMARLTKQDIKIFPSYMFNPEHFTGEKYSGEDKIYSRHFYGSTVENTYEKGVQYMPVDKIIAAHPQTISTMVHIDQMRYILDNFYSVMSIPGDVVELGCNVGTTALYIRRLLNLVETGKEFHVYDSFEGLPDANEHDGNPPRLNKGNLAKEKSAFEQSFKDAGLEFPIIHKGFFGELLDENYPQKICFAFFDGDLFSSILDSFCKVYPKMSKGGIIIVHDYEGAELPGVKKACEYFLSDKPEKVCEVFRGMAKIVKE